MIRLLEADTHPAWCPGCGNYQILKCLDSVLDDCKTDRHKLVLVSGIGQAAKLPHYLEANVFNGLHGRALPVAAGIKLANHSLQVVVTSGDGDMYGEGGNHFIHNIRRNLSIKAFVHNNQVYGLTKGQASPTSDIGFVTPVQVHGQKLNSFNPLALAIVEDAAFVARSFSGDSQHLKKMMKAALEHKEGFVLLDILQPCVSFNHVNTFKWYRERVKVLPDSHDCYDKMAALDVAMRWGDEIPLGIIYKSKRKSFESQSEVLHDGPLIEHYSRS